MSAERAVVALLLAALAWHACGLLYWLAQPTPQRPGEIRLPPVGPYGWDKETNA